MWILGLKGLNVVHELAEFNYLHCSNSCNIFEEIGPFRGCSVDPL